MPPELPGVSTGPGDRPTIDDVLADRRRRLRTALHQLARELVQARRRNRQLERELERLRAVKPPMSPHTTR